MKLTLTVIFLLMCGSLFPQTEIDRNIRIKVTEEWINKLRHYDYSQNNSALLEEFERFITPDSLSGSKVNDHLGGGILNPMFADLDNDTNDELIGLFGWTEYEPALAVFKMTGKEWFLLYFEPFYNFYNSPQLQIANNFSGNKAFYIKWMYERGSGVFCDAFHFYKIIDNKVVPCLALINRAHIFGWGLSLNQKVEMDFNYNCANADELWVNYHYNFFAGPVYEDDAPWDGHEDISFIKGDNGLSYHWDPITLTYKPKFYANKKESLTEEKISCFGAFGNDTLFVKAFDYEINQTLEKGTEEQKKLLERYLEGVKTIINSDSTLQTGWYYIVETDNGFKRQLEKDSLFYFIDPIPIVTNKNIVKYEIYTSNCGSIGLSMKLDDNGTIAWSEATERATGKELAFIVDNKLMQVARVNSKISGGMTALNRGIYTKGELEEIQMLIEN